MELSLIGYSAEHQQCRRAGLGEVSPEGGFIDPDNPPVVIKDIDSTNLSDDNFRTTRKLWAVCPGLVVADKKLLKAMEDVDTKLNVRKCACRTVPLEYFKFFAVLLTEPDAPKTYPSFNRVLRWINHLITSLDYNVIRCLTSRCLWIIHGGFSLICIFRLKLIRSVTLSAAIVDIVDVPGYHKFEGWGELLAKHKKWIDGWPKNIPISGEGVAYTHWQRVLVSSFVQAWFDPAPAKRMALYTTTEPCEFDRCLPFLQAKHDNTKSSFLPAEPHTWLVEMAAPAPGVLIRCNDGYIALPKSKKPVIIPPPSASVVPSTSKVASAAPPAKVKPLTSASAGSKLSSAVAKTLPPGYNWEEPFEEVKVDLSSRESFQEYRDRSRRNSQKFLVLNDYLDGELAEEMQMETWRREAEEEEMREEAEEEDRRAEAEALREEAEAKAARKGKAKAVPKKDYFDYEDEPDFSSRPQVGLAGRRQPRFDRGDQMEEVENETSSYRGVLKRVAETGLDEHRAHKRTAMELDDGTPSSAKSLATLPSKSSTLSSTSAFSRYSHIRPPVSNNMYEHRLPAASSLDTGGVRPPLPSTKVTGPYSASRLGISNSQSRPFDRSGPPNSHPFNSTGPPQASSAHAFNFSGPPPPPPQVLGTRPTQQPSGRSAPHASSSRLATLTAEATQLRRSNLDLSDKDARKMFAALAGRLGISYNG